MALQACRSCALGIRICDRNSFCARVRPQPAAVERVEAHALHCAIQFLPEDGIALAKEHESIENGTGLGVGVGSTICADIELTSDHQNII